jgi:taurine dioxygenase
MTIAINPKAALGAEVTGIDLSKPIADHDVEAIEHVWNERLVVVFHGQKLSDPQLIAFSKRVLHRRDPFDPKSRRVMHCSQIKGSERIA